MQRLGLLARRFGFDVLIVVAAIDSAIEVATQRLDPQGERRSWCPGRESPGSSSLHSRLAGR